MRGSGGDGEFMWIIIHIGVGGEQDLARQGVGGINVITGIVEVLSNVLDK